MAKRLEFYDVGARKKFKTSNYQLKIIESKGVKKKMAVTKSPRGYKVTKFVPLDFKK